MGSDFHLLARTLHESYFCGNGEEELRSFTVCTIHETGHKLNTYPSAPITHEHNIPSHHAPSKTNPSEHIRSPIQVQVLSLVPPPPANDESLPLYSLFATFASRLFPVNLLTASTPNESPTRLAAPILLRIRGQQVPKERKKHRQGQSVLIQRVDGTKDGESRESKRHSPEEQRDPEPERIGLVDVRVRGEQVRLQAAEVEQHAEIGA